MDLGSDLRQARERAGLSLPELSARTRIPLRSLLAIEENDFDKIPPGIFLRSFIRTYAREVGVDPAAAIAELRAMTDPIEEFPSESKAKAIENKTESESILRELFEARSRWGYALIVAGLLVGVTAMNHLGAEKSSVAPNDVAAAPSKASAPTAQPAPVEQPAPVAQTLPVAEPLPVSTTGAGLQMEIRAQDHCWVRAVVDGQPTLERLLQPGETQSLTAQRDIVLRVGDPAAFSYSVNGRTGEPLGAGNEPVTVRFGTDGHASPVS